MRGGDSERRAFPVRGCLSVAEGGPMRSPNSREGIHGAPRIARIYTYDVCRNLHGLQAVWAISSARVHWWLLLWGEITKFWD